MFGSCDFQTWFVTHAAMMRTNSGLKRSNIRAQSNLLRCVATVKLTIRTILGRTASRRDVNVPTPPATDREKDEEPDARHFLRQTARRSLDMVLEGRLSQVCNVLAASLAAIQFSCDT